MKKWIAILSVLLLLFPVTGCENISDLDDEEYSSEPVAAVESAENITPSEAQITLQDYYETEHGEATEAAIQDMLRLYREYMTEAAADPVRQEEVTPRKTRISIGLFGENMDVCTIEMNGRRMQYTLDIMGSPDENGLYPLYITLHGGGGTSKQENNGEWQTMRNYYRDNVTNGIYVAVRGIEDTWNMHFTDDVFPLYDRLIEDLVLLKKADPNRVYLLGFSAGGDGVYGVAPRMADKFAAVNMSSGHPNGVSLLNVSNLPFEIQVGIRDFYTEDALRSVRGAEFENILNGYHEQYGYDFTHRVLVHVPEGHNFNDHYVVDDDFFTKNGLDGSDPAAFEVYVLKDPAQFAERALKEDWAGKFLDIYESLGIGSSVMSMSYDSSDALNARILEFVTDDLHMEVTKEEDTNAVHFVDQYVRDPIPYGFLWDLQTRASKRKDTAFYWLKADYSVDRGLVDAIYDRENNTVYVEISEEVNGEISLLANPFLMDFDRPLNVVTLTDEFSVELKADPEIMAESVRETGDMYLSWADEIAIPIP